jgi:hypothetical protein
MKRRTKNKSLNKKLLSLQNKISSLLSQPNQPSQKLNKHNKKTKTKTKIKIPYKLKNKE